MKTYYFTIEGPAEELAEALSYLYGKEGQIKSVKIIDPETLEVSMETFRQEADRICRRLYGGEGLIDE